VSAAIAYEPFDLRILAALEERHFWFRSRRRIIVDALRRWFPGARSYLEIGSGTGYVARGIAEAFPELRVVASDPLPGSAGCARIDARNVPFAGAFDVVGAYDVLEPGYPITPGDLDAACALAGVEVEPGDVVLVRTGQTAHLALEGRPVIGGEPPARDLLAYTWPTPGLTVATAGWAGTYLRGPLDALAAVPTGTYRVFRAVALAPGGNAFLAGLSGTFAMDEVQAP